MITVCLPTYNDMRFLDERLSSLSHQLPVEFDVVACDSASTDGTFECLSTVEGLSLDVYTVPREGAYAGWNECIRRASGEYVYIATADDTAYPGLLEKLSRALDENPDVDLAYSGFDFIDSTGAIAATSRVRPLELVGQDAGSGKRNRVEDLLVHCLVGVAWVTITAVLVRRRLFERIGLFRSDCGALSDQLWAVAAACSTDSIYIPERLATWRIHDAQVSGKIPSSDYARHRTNLREYLTKQELPEALGRDPEAVSCLIRGAERAFLRSFFLDRRHMRNRPSVFLRGFANAFARAPNYALQRLVRGFSWDHWIFEDELVHYTNCRNRWVSEG